jgi:hypothetical protein
MAGLILAFAATGCGKSTSTTSPDIAALPGTAGTEDVWTLRPGDNDPMVKGKSLSVWMKQLQVRNTDKRIEAAKAIGELRRAGEPAVPALLVAYTDKDEYVGGPIKFALVMIGPSPRPPVSTLLHLMLHDDGGLGDWAARSLGKKGTAAKEAVPTLVQVAKERSNISQPALNALWKIDRKEAEKIGPPEEELPDDM